MLDELVHAGHEHLEAAYVEGYKVQADPAEDVALLRELGLNGTSVWADEPSGLRQAD